MTETIKNLYYRYQDVLSSIYINVNDGEFFFNGGSIPQMLTEIHYQDFFDLTENQDSDYFWLDATHNPFSTEHEGLISLGKVIGDDSSEASGVIVFNIKRSWLESVLNDGYITENGSLFLLSSQQIVFPENSEIPSLVFKQIEEGQQKIQVNSKDYHTVAKAFSINDWKLIAVFPDRDLKIGQESYFTLALTLIVFLIVIGTLIIVVLDQFVSVPIRRFAYEIEGISINGQPQQLNVEGVRFKELMILYDSFNKMIHRNSRLMQENHDNSEERNRLKIELLQSQINPHFLYNTLYSIQSLSDMNMNEEASMMTRALADFYRQGVSDEKIIVSLADELSHLEIYLTIMELRYRGRFIYKIKVDQQEALKARIPKLSLQPVVENSISHGLKEISEKGLIKINVKMVKDSVQIIILDNGKGIKPENIMKINREINQPAGKKNNLIGIGLRSINLRIKQYFGEGYGLWLERTTKGAQVKIIIPKGEEDAKTIDCGR
ncbi:histidine kinase [Amphibacillus sp. MSJ-3]|uniref:sensor histidine kinase n=1 Tax=Amphibacillus sp. MSJ-3 TaxID=2841505 RepID=UPI001C0EA44C|nr:histidine kinase [Amphibacillus sp. MSJ-3]MBU5594256.1 histidine kinase [Amphibacillus sp. MSJ-3]